jgi:alpha-amylase
LLPISATISWGLRRLSALALAACSSAAPLPGLDTTPVAVADSGSPLPDDWQRGTFIQIYVRGYQDSNGDGIGDLAGVTQRLDYLRELGVTGIWLMPITRSQDRDHGYAVIDYRDIEPAYGGLDELDALIAAAHARGIGVIIDYVVNHSAASHPAFAASRAASDSPFRSWYVWRADRPPGWRIYGSDPWYPSAGSFYFAVFGSDMPDFNLLDPAVIAFHHDNLRFWLNRGVDGFRFDAVGNLIESGATAWEAQPASRAVMAEIRRVLDGYARRYLVCEAPADPAGFAADTACGSAFAFGHQGDVIRAARGEPAAIQALASHGTTASPASATFLSNHDTFAGQRVFDQLRGDLAQYRLAAATYLLQPGIPFVYYGEEIGMAGIASGGDPGLRTPMSWTGDARTAGFTTGAPFRALAPNLATHNVADEAGDPRSLLTFYRAMIGLRRSLPAIARGSYRAPAVAGRVLSFQRVLGGEHALVVLNYGTEATVASLADLPTSARFATAYPGGGGELITDAAGRATLAVGSQAVVVLVRR